MEEYAKTEQLQNLNEEQLQAITGATGSGSSSPIPDTIQGLHDKWTEYHQRAGGAALHGDEAEHYRNLSKADTITERLQAAYRPPTPEAPPAPAPKKSFLRRCFSCFK